MNLRKERGLRKAVTDLNKLKTKARAARSELLRDKVRNDLYRIKKNIEKYTGRPRCHTMSHIRKEVERMLG